MMEKAQLILMENNNHRHLAVVISVFPEHLMICEVGPQRIQRLRPVMLTGRFVRGCRLDLDMYIYLMTLKITDKRQEWPILGKIPQMKFYEVLRKVEWLFLGNLQVKRLNRQLPGSYQ